ncbi:hypothetical protein RYX36_021561 [Vicia faba]
MSEDPHSPRFMCYLSILTFFMPMLVTGDNSLQLFLGWEGVGLASYLLIHFWFTRLQADKAATKAIPVNRVGDFGLAPGISGRFTLFQTVDFSTIFARASAPRNSWISCNMRLNAITLICILLLIGAVGKSAQIGSHTWSPDAMEGPTPVSALIHAATMVTAGVFMIARCSPLFEYPPTALIVITSAGATTSFLAATTGILQNNLKRVIAYSTCSQLGYMIFACGISNYSVSVFHLMNHAFFKALLFLSAVWSTDHTEGQALKRRTGTSRINVFQFLALHRPSNGPWTKRPLPERTMSRGPPPPHKGACHLLTNIGIYSKEEISSCHPYEDTGLDVSSSNLESYSEYENMDLENFVYEKVSEEIEARKEASERVPFHLHTPNALLSLVDDIDVLADSVSKQSGKVRGTSSYEDPQSSMVQDVDPSRNEGFDFVPPTGGDSFGRYEIASLCLGMMHFHFGHPKLALEVLTEAVRISQQHSNDTCLAYTLAAISNLLFENGISSTAGIHQNNHRNAHAKNQ